MLSAFVAGFSISLNQRLKSAFNNQLLPPAKLTYFCGYAHKKYLFRKYSG